MRLLFVIALLASVPLASALELSRDDASRIGRRIWQNECAGSVAGLTSWNEGENFASLGIGHFIWYPAGARGPFEESFPPLMRFIAAKGGRLPEWLGQAEGAPCPWNSRTEFAAAQSSARMKELRQFLAGTVDLQAQFLVARLETALPKLLAAAPATERENVRRRFGRVAGSAQGSYALVDYVNFKGEGVLATERYRGEGWGLLQVLAGMQGNSGGAEAVAEFARSAKAVLTRRVTNAPPERHEARWLPGWLNRIGTY